MFASKNKKHIQRVWIVSFFSHKVEYKWDSYTKLIEFWRIFIITLPCWTENLLTMVSTQSDNKNSKQLYQFCIAISFEHINMQKKTSKMSQQKNNLKITSRFPIIFIRPALTCKMSLWCLVRSQRKQICGANFSSYFFAGSPLELIRIKVQQRIHI